MKEQSNMENKQKVERNLAAISQIIIFQLLIITIIKKIIIVSKFFFFYIWDDNISNLWGLFHDNCSYQYLKTLIGFFSKKIKNKKDTNLFLA